MVLQPGLSKPLEAEMEKWTKTVQDIAQVVADRIRVAGLTLDETKIEKVARIVREGGAFALANEQVDKIAGELYTGLSPQLEIAIALGARMTRDAAREAIRELVIEAVDKLEKRGIFIDA